jgi:hypothetical protein
VRPSSTEKAGGEQLDRVGTNPSEEHIDAHAFDHPATYEIQKTIWMPVDAAGLYKGEYESVKASGVSPYLLSPALDAC